MFKSEERRRTTIEAEIKKSWWRKIRALEESTTTVNTTRKCK